MRPFISFFVLVLLSACETGLKEGALNSTFPPDGWETTTTERRTQYLCNPPSCPSTELVLVDDLEIVGLSEGLIRNGKVGPEAVAKLDALIAKARKGRYQAKTSVPVATDTYAGFRHKATIDDEGRTIFLAGQSIVQGNVGSIVLSLAFEESIAERNLNAYLSATQIERPS